jgi:voltage-gated potassium channel
MREFVTFIRNLLHMLYFVRGVLLGLVIVLVVCAFITAELENMPLTDAFYFTFITALTVGYGDIAPKTDIGRIVSLLVAADGVIIFGLVVAVSNRALHRAVEQEKNNRVKKSGPDFS